MAKCFFLFGAESYMSSGDLVSPRQWPQSLFSLLVLDPNVMVA